MVECTALEMRHTGNRIGGSNPSLSANHTEITRIFLIFCVLKRLNDPQRRRNETISDQVAAPMIRHYHVRASTTMSGAGTQQNGEIVSLLHGQVPSNLS